MCFSSSVIHAEDAEREKAQGERDPGCLADDVPSRAFLDDSGSTLEKIPRLGMEENQHIQAKTREEQHDRAHPTLAGT